MSIVTGVVYNNRQNAVKKKEEKLREEKEKKTEEKREENLAKLTQPMIVDTPH